MTAVMLGDQVVAANATRVGTTTKATIRTADILIPVSTLRNMVTVGGVEAFLEDQVLILPVAAPALFPHLLRNMEGLHRRRGISIRIRLTEVGGKGMLMGEAWVTILAVMHLHNLVTIPITRCNHMGAAFPQLRSTPAKGLGAAFQHQVKPHRTVVEDDMTRTATFRLLVMMGIP
jgi:hypothetical protein